MLIREIDFIMSGKVHIESLHANSLLKCKCKDEIYDSYMINYYWGNIMKISGNTDNECSSFLEYIIDVFYNVKGFAISRKVKQSMCASTSKASLSFRCTLK